MKEPIEIRAHHLACIPRFYHGGYDETFAANMKKVCQYIRKNPSCKVKVIVAKLDILCKDCPHKYNNTCVQSKKIGVWVNAQDKKVAKQLGLQSDSIYFAKDVFNLSMEKINEQTINSVCEGCIFLKNCIKVGINNAFRKELNKN